MPAVNLLNALISQQWSWELAEYASVAAVFIGVAGESIHEFTAWFRQHSWWKANGGKASALLLVVALAAELVTTIKSNSISGQIIALVTERAATLEKDAAQLRLDLAKVRGPRNLDSTSVERIITRLKPLGAKPCTLGVLIGGLEAGSSLAEQLRSSLVSAGWYLVPHKNKPTSRSQPATNQVNGPHWVVRLEC